jgi:transcriptional regulator with XRE-family HTH domain
MGMVESLSSANVADPLSEKQARGGAAASAFGRRFGEAVRKRRQTLRITQEQLAAAVQASGVQASQSYVSLLEAGQRTDPDTRLVAAIAVLLDISLDALLASQIEGEAE